MATRTPSKPSSRSSRPAPKGVLAEFGALIAQLLTMIWTGSRRAYRIGRGGTRWVGRAYEWVGTRVLCPQCGREIPQRHLESHNASHQVANDQQRHRPPPATPPPIPRQPSQTKANASGGRPAPPPPAPPPPPPQPPPASGGQGRKSPRRATCPDCGRDGPAERLQEHQERDHGHAPPKQPPPPPNPNADGAHNEVICGSCGGRFARSTISGHMRGCKQAGTAPPEGGDTKAPPEGGDTKAPPSTGNPGGDDMAGRANGGSQGRQGGGGTAGSSAAAAFLSGLQKWCDEQPMTVSALRAHLLSMDEAMGKAPDLLSNFAANAIVGRKIHPSVAQPIIAAGEQMGAIRHNFSEAYSRFETIYADRLAYERSDKPKPDDTMFKEVG